MNYVYRYMVTVSVALISGEACSTSSITSKLLSVGRRFHASNAGVIGAVSARQQATKIADNLFQLYETEGQKDYIGEDISQLEHALQSANKAVDARSKNPMVSEELVLAALLHDVGQFCDSSATPMGHLGAVQHEWVGAHYLAQHGFSSYVTMLVGLHVDAKRFLVSRDPHYFNRLSDASKKTFMEQGGMMSAQEILAFKRHPLYAQALMLRSWEDQAKVKHARVRPLSYYYPMMVRHVASQLSGLKPFYVDMRTK